MGDLMMALTSPHGTPGLNHALRFGKCAKRQNSSKTEQLLVKRPRDALTVSEIYAYISTRTMSILAESCHELFAYSLARGEFPESAYTTAGHEPNYEAAQKGATEPVVKGRVHELLEEAAGDTVGSICKTIRFLVDGIETAPGNITPASRLCEE